jgi:hypothetical protein
MNSFFIRKVPEPEKPLIEQKSRLAPTPERKYLQSYPQYMYFWPRLTSGPVEPQISPISQMG